MAVIHAKRGQIPIWAALEGAALGAGEGRQVSYLPGTGLDGIWPRPSGPHFLLLHQLDALEPGLVGSSVTCHTTGNSVVNWNILGRLQYLPSAPHPGHGYPQFPPSKNPRQSPR